MFDSTNHSISGSESQVPVGLLEVKLELIPKLNDSVTDEVISAQVGMEKARKAEKERLFLVYAKQWWHEYLQIRTSHKDRLVKIFAQVRENSAGIQ
jgi:centrosomal protein CEP76